MARAKAQAKQAAEAQKRARAEKKAQAKQAANAEKRAKARPEAKAVKKAEKRARAEKKAQVKLSAEAEKRARAEEKAQVKQAAEAEKRAKAEEKARVKQAAEAEKRAKARPKAKAAKKAETRARAEEMAKARVKAEKKAKARVRAKAAPRRARKPAPRMPRFPTLKIGGGKAGKRIMALSIESTELRLVSYNKGAIESWDRVSFDPQLLTMGLVADPEGLGIVIKSALEGRGASTSQMVCAPLDLKVESRLISIPKLGKKEMESVIPREIRRLLDITEEDNYVHWQALPTETNQVPVFALAVPKETLLDFIETLRVGGVRPRAIDLKPLALMRAVNQKDAIIANGESNSVELVIVIDDVPVLMRSIFLGEGEVSEDYAVGRISDELKRTVDTYNDTNKDNPLDPEMPIYLSGATASSVPFALNVAALTGRTVQPLEPPIRYPEDFPLAEYMVNVGLILKIL